MRPLPDEIQNGLSDTEQYAVHAALYSVPETDLLLPGILFSYYFGQPAPGKRKKWILHNREQYKKNIMAKYSKKAGEKVEKVMHEMKEGTLKSGSGKKVKSRKQAIAIGLSEARKEGARVPKKKNSAPTKAASKKAAGKTKKSTTKKRTGTSFLVGSYPVPGVGSVIRSGVSLSLARLRSVAVPSGDSLQAQ